MLFGDELLNTDEFSRLDNQNSFLLYDYNKNKKYSDLWKFLSEEGQRPKFILNFPNDLESIRSF